MSYDTDAHHLADGEEHRIPGQRAPLARLVREGRMVAPPIPLPERLRMIAAAYLGRSTKA